MLRAELGEHAHDVRATVLRKGARDHLHRARDRLHRPLSHALRLVGRLHQGLRNRHLGRTASRKQARFEHDVADDLHRILKIALDLVQHVLRATTQQDGARLGVVAFLQEGEVFVAQLAHFKQAAALPDVALEDLAVRETMVAPVARATRLLSVYGRRNAVMFAFIK